MTETQRPILTVTLNPALDLSARVEAMVPGLKLRLDAPVVEPGGGGVNVARVISALGGSVTAWAALGGASGEQHRALMTQAGVAPHVFDLPGDTRATWAVTDAEGRQFRLQLPGPDWTEALCARALDDICAAAKGLVVLSGSQPPGVPVDFASQLCARLGAERLAVDTSGAALDHLCAGGATGLMLLRLDQAEAARVAGQELSLAEAPALARALHARGLATHVCIARGAAGSVMAAPDALWSCAPPRVKVESIVGAGDSFTGAFVLALARGAPAREALQAGTAAAAAAVMTGGSALCRAEDVARLAPDCRLEEVPA